MAILVLPVYAAVFVALWLFLHHGLKRILKDKYKRHYATVGFCLISPFVLVLLGFAAVALLPFPPDP